MIYIKHTVYKYFISRTATNLPRKFHFHQTATILQRHTLPRIYHVTQIACRRYINVCIWLEPFDFGYG